MFRPPLVTARLGAAPASGSQTGLSNQLLAVRDRPRRISIHQGWPSERPVLPRSALSPDAVSAAVTSYLLVVIRYRVLISGQVQGVYFRSTCRRMALEHGVSGWVRNLPDGRVEAVFEGPAENVHRLLGWTRRGPHLAVVADTVVQAEHPEGLGTFLIR
jgi:acylphosphatase